MHKQGPLVVMTCSMCGSAQSVQSLIRVMNMPQESRVEEHIFVPLLVHCADGGHMVAHPAIPFDQMESM